MLFLVLLLVLAALGLLVAALVTSKSLFAWISIALSIAAAVALFVDWLRRRRAERRAADPDAADAAADEEATEATEAAEALEVTEGDAEQPADAEATEESGEPEPAEPVAEPAEPAEEPTKVLVKQEDPQTVPDEEETDAADLLIVCELPDQVIVVDEHPRYHRADCSWLAEKDTIPIAVSEARELGFTPCARCGPDAKLAEQARRKRVAGKS